MKRLKLKLNISEDLLERIAQAQRATGFWDVLADKIGPKGLECDSHLFESLLIVGLDCVAADRP